MAAEATTTVVSVQSPIVRDSHETWPSQGDVIEVRKVTKKGVVPRYYLLVDEEPIQQLRIEFEVAGPPTEEFKDHEVRELEIETSPEEEVIFYYARIGVVRGNILLLNPQLRERWGLDKYKDPKRGIQEGVLAGFIDPIVSPAYEPSPWSGFWILGNNVWPVLRGWNPHPYPLKIACIIYPLKFTALEITRDNYPELYEKLERRLIKTRTLYVHAVKPVE
ncbi:MAG: hypothetical protein DRJ47_10125 [Thermoprotei archaeon]|nr:MAG: hypothetical protein DRJ47_10125 [Thermoprotei archaeon]